LNQTAVISPLSSATVALTSERRRRACRFETRRTSPAIATSSPERTSAILRSGAGDS
jgi:hypothetical protein